MTKQNTNADLIQIFSHVRSGTHLLEAFLAKNFYSDVRLRKLDAHWGHWSNRKRRWTGNKYGKLFGNHFFAEENFKRINFKPSIYIVRDGRAVVYSVWKTPNFKNKDWADIPLSEFLHKNIDWDGTPSRKANPSISIVEHWKKHVDGWVSVENENLLIVHYEDLVRKPENVAKQIAKKFDLELPEKLHYITSPTGLKPNAASISSWKEEYTDADLDFFFSIVSNDHWALDK